MDLTCPYCSFSKSVPRGKIPESAKWAICPRCRQKFAISGSYDVFSHEQGQTISEKKSNRTGAPWERRTEIGLWQGIYRTCKEALFSPENLFVNMHHTQGISEPFSFGLLIGTIGTMFGLFWQFLTVSGGLLAFGESLFGHISLGLIFLIVLIIVPIFVSVSIFIYAGILHLLLLIVRGGGNRFEATFRVIAYSQAAQALSLVPLIGGWAAGIWQLIIQIIGLKEIHETSYLRIIIAFLIPVVFIVLLIVMAIVIPFILFATQWL